MPGSRKSSKRKSKKSSRKTKRVAPQGFKDFGDFVTHIVKKLGIKRPEAMRLAKIYKDDAKKENPNVDSVEATKLGKEQFDSDGGKKLSQIKKSSRSKRGSKKASRRSSKTHEKYESASN